MERSDPRLNEGDDERSEESTLQESLRDLLALMERLEWHHKPRKFRIYMNVVELVEAADREASR